MRISNEVENLSANDDKPGRISRAVQHYHLEEEEHIFILKGRAILIVGSRGYIMKERLPAASPRVSAPGIISSIDQNAPAASNPSPPISLG
jgi:hypothetical protein